jgi:hypothetical protein
VLHGRRGNTHAHADLTRGEIILLSAVCCLIFVFVVVVLRADSPSDLRSRLQDVLGVPTDALVVVYFLVVCLPVWLYWCVPVEEVRAPFHLFSAVVRVVIMPPTVLISRSDFAPRI